MGTSGQEWRGLRVGLPALAVVIAGGHAWYYSGIADDAFVMLRYARNLLDGHGLVYNVGERVEGYTSFLWTLTLSLAGRLGIDLLAASRWLGLFCTLGLVLVAARLAGRVIGDRASRRVYGWLPAVPAFIVACNAPTAAWSLGGLETTAFALLVASSVLVASRPRSDVRWALVTGTLLGLTALARPEGLLIGGVIGVTSLATDREGSRIRRVLPMALVFVAITGAHLLWRHAYYGDWLPNTYYAKVGHDLSQFAAGLGYVVAYFRDYGGFLLWLAPLAAAFWRRDRAWWIVAATWVSLLGAVAWVGGDGLFMYRFMVAQVALWAVLLVSLLADGLEFLARTMPAIERPRAVAAVAAVLALVAASGLLPDTESDEYLRFVRQRDIEIPRWTAVGRLLQWQGRPGDSVACVPIGAIGYYSGLKVHDMLGLTDRHIARLEVEMGEGWSGHEKHDGPYILSLQPTYLLLGNVRVEDKPIPADSPRFVLTGNPWIDRREGDIFVPEFFESYRPAISELPGGSFLHYFERKGG